MTAQALRAATRRVIYLSGAPRDEFNSEEWGVMLTPQMGNRLAPTAVWAVGV